MEVKPLLSWDHRRCLAGVEIAAVIPKRQDYRDEIFWEVFPQYQHSETGRGMEGQRRAWLNLKLAAKLGNVYDSSMLYWI